MAMLFPREVPEGLVPQQNTHSAKPVLIACKFWFFWIAFQLRWHVFLVIRITIVLSLIMRHTVTTAVALFLGLIFCFCFDCLRSLWVLKIYQRGKLLGQVSGYWLQQKIITILKQKTLHSDWTHSQGTAHPTPQPPDNRVKRAERITPQAQLRLPQLWASHPTIPQIKLDLLETVTHLHSTGRWALLVT